MERAQFRVRRLSPKIKMLWFAQYIVAGLIVWVVLSIVALNVNIPFLSSLSEWSRVLLILGMVVLLLLPVFVWIELRYKNFTFAFMDTGMLIREGVVYKKRIDIPYSAIENVAVDKPLVQRLLGIGTLVIDTAGGDEKEGILPGVDSPDETMNELLEMIKSVKGSGEKERSEKSLSLLKEIRDELRSIKELLATKPEKKRREKRSPTEPFTDIFKHKRSN